MQRHCDTPAQSRTEEEPRRSMFGIDVKTGHKVYAGRLSEKG